MDGKVIIRALLAVALMYAIFTETGIWTAITFGLIFVGLELQG